MHLFACPHCQADVSVAPSKAGQEMDCPQCGGTLSLPKLGELRKLPRVDPDSSVAGGQRNDESLGGGAASSDGEQSAYSIVFAGLALVATACLLIAGFCGIRWALIDPGSSTEEHIAGLQEAYQGLTAAELIREYEDMEKLGIDYGSPYNYQITQNLKDEWGFNALVAAGVGGLAIVGAGLAGSKR